MNHSSAKTLTPLQRKRPRMILWIRTVAGPDIGFGHLRRALILARRIRHVARPVFLLDDTDTWSAAQASLSGFEHHRFDRRRPWPAGTEAVALLIDTRCKAGLRKLIAEAHKRGIPVASIHDLGLSPLSSDVILDGSIRPGNFAHNRCAASFTGTKYLVIDPGCRRFYSRPKSIRPRIRNVVINLGGGDASRLYPILLEGLCAASSRLEVVGFPGFCSWGQEELARRRWGSLRFRWLAKDEEAAALTFAADLVLTAGGLSAYEAMCLGTPLCALSYDRHQEITVGALARAGGCLDLGRGTRLICADVADIFKEMDRHPDYRRHLSACGRRLIDGNGAGRVARILRIMIAGGRINNAAQPLDLHAPAIAGFPVMSGL